VLGQLFLFACIVAAGSIAAILFVVLGPVPVKRRVVIVPRLSASGVFTAPSLVSQLAPAVARQHITSQSPVVVEDPHPATAVPPPAPVVAPRRGGKVQPMPRKRAAQGTASPFAPVVNRNRAYREEDAATNPVRMFDAEELTIDDTFRPH
jgi:hypothetical protein